MSRIWQWVKKHWGWIFIASSFLSFGCLLSALIISEQREYDTIIHDIESSKWWKDTQSKIEQGQHIVFIKTPGPSYMPAFSAKIRKMEAEGWEAVGMIPPSKMSRAHMEMRLILP